MRSRKKTSSKGVSDLCVLEAEVQTEGGLQGVSLIPRKLGGKAIRKHNENLSNLNLFVKDGVELAIAPDGRAFATQAGYTRMSGIPKTTVVSRTQKGVRNGEVKEAQIQTEGGLQGVRLIPVKKYRKVCSSTFEVYGNPHRRVDNYCKLKHDYQKPRPLQFTETASFLCKM